MKRPLKIILLISLAINVTVISMQVVSHFQRKNYKEGVYPRETQKIVNIPVVKKNFLDSLYLSYPQLKTKKYLFFHFWSTRHYWCTKPLPIYDTLILPLNPEMGYILVNDEKEEYSKKTLKDDAGTTKNFLFAFNAEDFILATNQELKFKYSRFWYPKYPMSVIMRTDSSKIIFFDTLGIVGKSAPEDSLRDKQGYALLKKALSELK